VEIVQKIEIDLQRIHATPKKANPSGDPARGAVVEVPVNEILVWSPSHNDWNYE
jgi:hypothetical protein